ncbi:S-type pyocin domain-containing protein [Pseudomonas brassicacearum]|nr:S-type pyocin domain-containing protein [Pseudomonas brassicacearum]
MREQRYNSEDIDAEYSGVFSKLTESTLKELEKANNTAAGTLILSSFEKAEIEQETTIKAIQSKESEYQAHTKDAYSLYGQNPFFLMKELPFRRIMDSLQTSPPNIMIAYAAINHAYRSALELKRLSLQKDVLAEKLEQSSKKAARLAATTQPEKNNSISSIDEKLSLINKEKNIRLQLLPGFLLKKALSMLDPTAGLALSKLLINHKTTITKIITAERAAIGAYTRANPNIKPPLSKPEFEALNNLVALQAKTNLGKRWQDYHVSLLHSESVRYLTRTTNTFIGLIERAESAERLKEQLRVAAEQKEQARKQAQATAQRAEQERKQKLASTLAGHFNELLRQFNHAQSEDIDQQLAWMRRKHLELAAAHRDASRAELAAGDLSGPMKNGSRETSLSKAQAGIDAIYQSKYHIENIPLSTVNGAMASARPLITTPGGLIAGYEGASFSFQSTINLLKKARAALAGGPLAAFGVAVSYSPTIGNSELQRNPVVISIPLFQLDEHFKLTPNTETGRLPLRVVSSVRGEHTQFYLSPTGGSLSSEVRIRYIALDQHTNLFTFTTEGILPRTLTWTPNNPPGDNFLGSTELPAAQPEIRILPGARITQIEGRVDEHPTCDDADIDDYVLVFPVESGINPVYIMASRTGPRYEPGIATGTGQEIRGNWLGSTEQGVGAPIPREIANLLRGHDFRDFDAFREKFWSRVANDEQLSAQFSRSNLKLMRNGAAPFTAPDGHVGERNKFEIHHIQLISDGGAVYDLDNLSIMTPKEHIELHKKGTKP